MAILDGPEVYTVDTRHGPVRVRDTGGGGTPILLVHGLLVDPDLYATLVPLLVARGHRCVVPELPLGAHGLPMRPDADLSPEGLASLLDETLTALDIDRTHVVGVDTGGALTQLLMADHREHVDRVVLTACDAYDAFPPRSFGPILKALRWPGALELLAPGTRFRRMRRLGVPRMVSHRGVDDDTLARFAAPLRRAAVRHDLRAVLRHMHPRSTLAAAAANRDFPGRVLIAWGDDDRAFPRALADRLERDLPDARRTVITNCAAFAALDQPEALAALVHEHVTAP